MDYRQLQDFVNRIILATKGNEVRTVQVLGELIRILESQNTQKSYVDLVRKIAGNLPETYGIPSDFSPDDVEIAARRSAERKRREEEARRNGRC